MVPPEDFEAPPDDPWGTAPPTVTLPARTRDFSGRPPREILHEVFGYDDFRGDQAAIVDQVVGGGDAVVLMPTGAGKSISYQVPALAARAPGSSSARSSRSCTTRSTRSSGNGVRAAYLNSTQAPPERQAVEQAFLAGELDLLYVAPERLLCRVDHGAAPARAPQRHRHRRGALRVAVGPRLPARLPRARRPRRALPGRAAHRAHRDGHP